MDKNKAIELIKLQVLGCLDSKSYEELKIYADTGEDFPFEELGQYQNLSALLPLNLTIETPGIEVKNKVAQRLYELKAELENIKAVEEIVIEEPEPISTSVVEEQTEDKMDDVLVEEEIIVSEPEPRKVVAEKETQPRVEEIKRDKKLKDVVDKEDFEKRTKEYISTYYDKQIKDLQGNAKISLIIAIAAAVIAIISIALNFV